MNNKFGFFFRIRFTLLSDAFNRSETFKIKNRCRSRFVWSRTIDIYEILTR